MGPRQILRRADVLGRQDLAVLRVLEAEQLRVREVIHVRLRLDVALDVLERHRPIRAHLDGLRLDTAEHCSASGLVAEGVCRLADQVLVAALAMGEDAAEIGLRTTRYEHAGFHAEEVGHVAFEFIHRRIFPVDVVADIGRHHGCSHRLGRLGQRVTSKIDHRLAR